MKLAFTTLYTNQVTPEHLNTDEKSPFTEEQLATFNEEALAIIKQQEDYKKLHPLIAIYRLAAQGSQTRNGGVIETTTSHLTFQLADGQQIRAAKKGDYAVYPDGTTAQIVTASGEAFNHTALVGSVLDNGDEIINTPQSSALLIEREGVPMADDFLPNH